MGFFVLITAGLCQGSFGLGYKKYSPFTWAAFWGIYSIICMIIPAMAMLLLMPDAGIKNIFIPFACGMLWGISAIGFSKAITKIGMSLVYGISMGISTVAGSLIPMLVSGNESTVNYILLTVGYTLTLLGVAVITIAAIKRDGEMKKSGVGILLAIFSGLGSGAMNVGFNTVNITADASFIAISAARWLPVLLGGGIMSVVWCIGELTIKREWSSILQQGAVKRICILFLVGLIWYGALLLYGVSVNMLGENYASVGWIIFNALALIVSTLWGIFTGEWKGKPKKLLFIGCALLILAWFFVGGM